MDFIFYFKYFFISGQFTEEVIHSELTLAIIWKKKETLFYYTFQIYQTYKTFARLKRGQFMGILGLNFAFNF